MTDTHCHIYSEYYDDINKVLENAKENGINKVINNGTNIETNEEVLKLSKKYKNMYPAIGFQPEELNNIKITDVRQVENHINEIIAIGEIGLDYYNSTVSRKKQIEIFEEQLRFAIKYEKPVIIHSRNAFDDTYNILTKYRGIKGSIHCFTGTIGEAKKYISLGLALGIGGILTFKNSNLEDIVKEIDLKDILLETDSPYLAPVPLRGKTNEPANIKYIAEKICKIKDVSLRKLNDTTEKNVERIFKIWQSLTSKRNMGKIF